ncbi:hypothetical protein ACFW2V_13045 [Streptomyces sp. NPDC058947]|uniref:hypothetical protein n=1 Tax=Streptomyces sp. NPDC058947 TaxID=3346675 RepID=UPI0036B510A7
MNQPIPLGLPTQFCNTSKSRPGGHGPLAQLLKIRFVHAHLAVMCNLGRGNESSQSLKPLFRVEVMDLLEELTGRRYDTFSANFLLACAQPVDLALQGTDRIQIFEHYASSS